MPLAQWIRSPWNRLGWLAAAVGVVIAAAARMRFRRVGTTVNPLDPSKASHLVTDGVFRVSRNPMYLALVLLLIGWAIWLGSASPWLVPPLFLNVLTVVQIIPRNRRSVDASESSIFRTDEAWRRGSAGIADAMLDRGRSASKPR
jgi:protein-S-isoprenylcysteine O-methyltransferase Ste14